MPKNVISIHRAKNRAAYLRRKERQREKPHVDRVLGLLHQFENIENLTDELSRRRLLRQIKVEISAVPTAEYGVEYTMYWAVLGAMWKNYCRNEIGSTLTP